MKGDREILQGPSKKKDFHKKKYNQKTKSLEVNQEVISTLIIHVYMYP